MSDNLPNKPESRIEKYLSRMAGENTPLPDKPESRVEQYLDFIARNGGIGGGSSVSVDNTLSVNGAAADAKAVGDALQEFEYLPDVSESGNGTYAIKQENDKLYLEELPEVEVDPTLSIEGAPADAKAVGDEITDIKQDLNSKADPDGTYDGMTVGTAKQLLSDTYTEDKVPYLLRPTGGSADVGTREFDSIVGGTVAWNQLIQNGNFESTSNWELASPSQGTFSVANNVAEVTSSIAWNGMKPTVYNIITGHKYFSSIDIKKNNASDTIGIYYDSNIYNLGIVYMLDDTAWHTYSAIINAKQTISTRRPYVDNATAVVSYSMRNCQLFDLTQMFGTAIADRAYALEQATAGSGIAWLKSMGFFTKDYYEYDAGTLKSVEGLVSHDTVGFNQWDEEWEVGALYYATGLPYAANNRIRSKYFECLPSTTYCWSCNSGPINMIMFEYDSEQNMLSRVVSETNQVSTFTTSDNARYLRFYLPETYGSTYNHDICINLSDPAKNGTYELYVKHSYPLDDSLTLRGIPKLDANNQLYYDGDEYAADGTVTRRYGVVDLGTLDWQLANTSVFLTSGAIQNIKIPPQSIDVTNWIICQIYGYSSPSRVYNANDNKAIAVQQTTGKLMVSDTTYTDAASFKSAMSGVYLVYELATPNTETAEPYHNPQICDPNGTEEYVTTGIVPVGHDTQYGKGLKDKIEGLPWDLSMIAPIENGTTARKAYTVGQYFLKDDQFCKALTSIASGATFTLNTNYAVTTVAAELYTALNS